MWYSWSPGTFFSKVPRTFRARNASCQTATHLFWKADLWKCCQWKRNQEDCEVRTLTLRRYKGNCGVWNRPEKFRNFWETGPRPGLLEAWAALTSVNYHWNVQVPILLKIIVDANNASSNRSQGFRYKVESHQFCFFCESLLKFTS